ncbi:hypothetical protein A3717_37450 [Alcanivorax sp. HI0013]|nr:hypothetical protein A3717_37450 [Alcanivorax sp. HI0013]
MITSILMKTWGLLILRCPGTRSALIWMQRIVLTVRLKQRVVSRRSCQTVPLILTPMVTAKPMYINKFDLFL